MTDRIHLRSKWLTQALRNEPNLHTPTITALPGDASFRNYFRIRCGEQQYLLMDAPPELENSDNFIAIANHYRMQQIRTPLIFAHNLELGFLLLEDFGNTLLADLLAEDNASKWYRLCYQELPKIQSCTHIAEQPLPHFVNQLLEQELNQFKTWVVTEFAQCLWPDSEEHLWQHSVQKIKAVCLEQPQVGVHRDYHSRNIMILSNTAVGIIDFQDAVIGPITYDLVSLLRDCYIDWPDTQVTLWLDDYYESFADPTHYSRAQLQRWFDWQGLQRHLKALFIFCRKYLRDGSSDYLAAIPRTLRYAINESTHYPELSWLHHFLKERLAEPLLNRVEKIIGTLK